jgi:uncharacterized iron-regulated membrane protein
MRRHLAIATAALLAVGAMILLPAAAQASVYPPSDSVVVSAASAQPGGSVQVSVKDGTFRADEDLTITTTGENGGGVTYGMLRTAIGTATYGDARATSAGGMTPVTVTFPANASGVYTIAVFSPSSPGATATVTIGALSATGLNASSTMGLWIGGGALVLAGAVIAVAVAVRRVQAHADA